MVADVETDVTIGGIRVRLSRHAVERCDERALDMEDVIGAMRAEPAKLHAARQIFHRGHERPLRFGRFTLVLVSNDGTSLVLLTVY